MAFGLRVAREHTVAGREARRHGRLALVANKGYAKRLRRRWQRRRQRRCGGRVRPLGEEGEALLQFFHCDHALLQQRADLAIQPALVVRRRQVLGRVHALDGVARFIDIANAGAAHGAVDRVHGPFPLSVEDRLVLLALHWPKVLHAAHIVYAVHTASTFLSAGTRTRRALCGVRILRLAAYGFPYKFLLGACGPAPRDRPSAHAASTGVEVPQHEQGHSGTRSALACISLAAIVRAGAVPLPVSRDGLHARLPPPVLGEGRGEGPSHEPRIAPLR